MMTTVILHIPHASRMIPPEDRKALQIDVTEERELPHMTDAWTDRLAEGLQLAAVRVFCPVSCLVGGRGAVPR